MIIIPFLEKKEVRPNFPCKSFRWTFQINTKFAGFVHQHFSGEEWKDNHVMVYGVYIADGNRFGFEHFYYDGPHCSF